MSTKPSTSFPKIIFITILIMTAIVIIGSYSINNQRQRNPIMFDGQRAYQDIQYQVDLGPRTPGSKAHKEFVIWIQSELNNAGWQTQVPATKLIGHRIQNIIARQS